MVSAFLLYKSLAERDEFDSALYPASESVYAVPPVMSSSRVHMGTNNNGKEGRPEMAQSFFFPFGVLSLKGVCAALIQCRPRLFTVPKVPANTAQEKLRWPLDSRLFHSVAALVVVKVPH